MGTLTTFVAPTTFIGALLLYFGFAYTDALYEQFGIDAATLGFSTQDYALRSGGALFLPIGAALAVGLLGVLAYYLVASLGRADAPTPPIVRWISLSLVGCGVLLFVVGLLCGFEVLDTGPLGTPLFLGGGLLVLLYGRLLLVKSFGARYPVLREKAALAIVAALIVLSSFWAVNVYAQDHGRSDAAYLTDRLWLRPQVVLDTTERLYFQYPGVQETVLPEGTPQQHFKFRYRGLRLLAQSGDRMFIIPQSWTPDRGNVLIIPLDGNVRVSFRPG